MVPESVLACSCRDLESTEAFSESRTSTTLSDSFLDENPDFLIETPQGRLRPSSGLCFGSRFLAADGRQFFEILPRDYFTRVRNRADFWRVWLIDICAEHVANRQAVFEETADGWVDAYFIDHGHLFGGPNADSKRHFAASRYLDERIYSRLSSEVLIGFQEVLQALDVDRLRRRIEAIPAEWCHASAREVFERSLQRLKMASLVRRVVERIGSDLERRTATGSETAGNNWKGRSEVLPLGLQGTGFGSSRTCLPHCA